MRTILITQNDKSVLRRDIEGFIDRLIVEPNTSKYNDLYLGEILFWAFEGAALIVNLLPKPLYSSDMADELALIAQKEFNREESICLKQQIQEDLCINDFE